MKLVLHIGTEKTGSTSIQKWLHRSRAELSRRGVFQSQRLDPPHNRRLAHAFQASVDPYLRQGGVRTLEAVESYRGRLTEGLEEEVMRGEADHDLMVISSEHLQSRLLSEEEVAGLGHWARGVFSKVTVLCYLRHQAEMRQSLYSTLVRQGYTAPIDAFDTDIDEDSLYYNHLMLTQRWAAVFGEENLVLREFARTKLLGGDIIRDFAVAGLPGLDARTLDFTPARDNAALTGAQIRAYRFVNKWISYIDRNGRPSRWNARAKRLADLVLRGLPSTGGRTAPTIAEQEVSDAIAEAFVDSNRRVSERFFGGSLFEHWASARIAEFPAPDPPRATIRVS